MHDLENEDANAARSEHDESEEFRRQRDLYGGDSDFTGRVCEVMAEFPNLKQPLVEELFDFMSDKGWMAGQSRLNSPGVPVWMQKFVKILKYIKTHPSPNAIYAVLHIWDDPALDDINGHLTQTEFADLLYPSTRIPNPAKAAVNNAVMDAQRFFGTPPRRDQRKENARAQMSAARIGKLKK
jgi:hypothetical protein